MRLSVSGGIWSKKGKSLLKLISTSRKYYKNSLSIDKYSLQSLLGETSAGKSTLINKILEKRIFKGRILESSSTICKIRNSERIKIITECDTGEIEETDLTDKCELGSEKGVKVLRDSLKKVTDMTLSMKSIHHRSVDIGFPIPFLMVRIHVCCCKMLLRKKNKICYWSNHERTPLYFSQNK